jgi:hypothetical protein
MMMEVWNPLGIVRVITAFNFPCVVLGWNACIALVCGNCIVWKGVSLPKETKKAKKPRKQGRNWEKMIDTMIFLDCKKKTEVVFDHSVGDTVCVECELVL